MYNFLGATQVSSSSGWSALLSSDSISPLGIQPIWKVTTSHWKGQAQSETLFFSSQQCQGALLTLQKMLRVLCIINQNSQLKKQRNKYWNSSWAEESQGLDATECTGKNEDADMVTVLQQEWERTPQWEEHEGTWSQHRKKVEVQPNVPSVLALISEPGEQL